MYLYISTIKVNAVAKNTTCFTIAVVIQWCYSNLINYLLLNLCQ